MNVHENEKVFSPYGGELELKVSEYNNMPSLSSVVYVCVPERSAESVFWCSQSVIVPHMLRERYGPRF